MIVYYSSFPGHFESDSLCSSPYLLSLLLNVIWIRYAAVDVFKCFSTGTLDTATILSAGKKGVLYD